MEIATTLGALAAAAPALSRLAAQPLPIKTAYHVAKLARLAGAEIDLFTERRNALIKELGTERDPTPEETATGQIGRVVQVKPEHVDTFTERLNELANVAVTLAWGPVDLAALETVSISPADVITLGALLKEPT